MGKSLKTAAVAQRKFRATFCYAVIPSEVEVSLANFLGRRETSNSGDVSTSLDMTRSESAALFHLVSRNLQLMSVGIAEINGMRDFVILKFEFDFSLL